MESPKVTFELTATIPVVQYGNMIPKIIVTADTYEQARDEALMKLEGLWQIYAERPLKKNGPILGASAPVEILTFTGEKVLWNEDKHEYTTLDGKHMVSGSEYAKSFEKPFDTALLSGKVGTKNKIDPQVIADMWKGNSKISTTFGNALHLAMEQWFKYKDAACGEKEYNLAKPAFLRHAVETFPLRAENIIPEVVLSNIANLMAGTADGLLITGEKRARVEDYKSDSDIEKNLPKHFRQLSYYSKILQLAGWSIEGLDVWNYTDKWERYESEVLEVN